MTFDIRVVGTGSSGNCVVIDNSLMIDAGLSVTDMKADLATVSAVFVTHQHGDHANPAMVNHLARHRPALLRSRVYMNTSTKTALQSKVPKHHDVLARCPVITGHDWETTVRVLNGRRYHVKAFTLVHNVENYGFVVTNEDGDTLIYATDTETMRHAPQQRYDYILVEGNWDEDKFSEMIGTHDIAIQQRALQNLRHLSVQKFEEFVRKYGHDETVSYQMHCSNDLGTRSLVGRQFTPETLKRRLEVSG